MSIYTEKLILDCANLGMFKEALILLEKFMRYDFKFGYELECFYRMEDEYHDDEDSDEYEEKKDAIDYFVPLMEYMSKLYEVPFKDITHSDDGSLVPDNYEDIRMEIKSPPLWANMKNINATIKILSEIEHFGVYVNDTCSLHIHISWPRINESEMAWLISQIAMNGDFVDRFGTLYAKIYMDDGSSFTPKKSGVELSHEEKYAQSEFLNHIATAVDDYIDDPDSNDISGIIKGTKYNLLNLHELGTIEWRGPRGFAGLRQFTRSFFVLFVQYIDYIRECLDRETIESLNGKVMSKRDFMGNLHINFIKDKKADNTTRLDNKMILSRKKGIDLLFEETENGLKFIFKADRIVPISIVNENHGCFIYEKDKKTGILDIKGKIIIPAEFDIYENKFETIILAKNNGDLLLTDTNGKPLSDEMFTNIGQGSIRSYSLGVMKFTKKNGNKVLVATGIPKIDYEAEYIESVKYNGEYGAYFYVGDSKKGEIYDYNTDVKVDDVIIPEGYQVKNLELVSEHFLSMQKDGMTDIIYRKTGNVIYKMKNQYGFSIDFNVLSNGHITFKDRNQRESRVLLNGNGKVELEYVSLIEDKNSAYICKNFVQYGYNYIYDINKEESFSIPIKYLNDYTKADNGDDYAIGYDGIGEYTKTAVNLTDRRIMFKGLVKFFGIDGKKFGIWYEEDGIKKFFVLGEGVK